MATIKFFRNVLLAAMATAAFACKKHDTGELDKAGASTDSIPAEDTQTIQDTVNADTISAGKEGINGSGIGSGMPNTSGETR